MFSMSTSTRFHARAEVCSDATMCCPIAWRIRDRADEFLALAGHRGGCDRCGRGRCLGGRCRRLDRGRLGPAGA